MKPLSPASPSQGRYTARRPDPTVKHKIWWVSLKKPLKPRPVCDSLTKQAGTPQNLVGLGEQTTSQQRHRQRGAIPRGHGPSGGWHVSVLQRDFDIGRGADPRRNQTETGQLKIERKFTTEAAGAYGAMGFTHTTSEIRNPDGKVVFKNDAVEVPEGWSQVASD
ncbi:MAG: hypothetical protein KA139_09825, partial [Rhodobacteraceae bacterium]|nr:hypothetical protein [Paracoccaceae bacterium]